MGGVQGWVALAGIALALGAHYTGIKVAIARGDEKRESMRSALDDLRGQLTEESRRRDSEIIELRRRTHELAGNMQSALLELSKATREIGGLASRMAEIDAWKRDLNLPPRPYPPLGR